MFICLDIDGVLAKFDDLAVSRFGPCDRTLYSLEKRWPDKLSEIKYFVEDPQTYRSLDTVSGSVEAVDKLRKLGHQLCVVTARPCTAGMDVSTRDWLFENYGRSFFPIVVVNWKDKANYIRFLKCDLVIDDAPHHINRLRELRVWAVVFDAPYNQDVEGDRISEWGELFELLGG